MMTMPEFEEEKRRLIATYGGTAQDAMQKRAQAMAQLYARSGWTERDLAEIEKIDHTRIGQLLRFGRYLLGTICPQAQGPNESQFRKAWQRTDKTASEEARFAAVAQLLEEQARTPPAKGASKRLARTILDAFADQRWHNLSTMQTRLEADAQALTTTLDAMRLRGAYHTFCERRRAHKDDGGWQYRFVQHHGQRIPLDLLTTELAPIIQGLKEQGHKNMATISPGSVARLAHELETILEKLAR